MKRLVFAALMFASSLTWAHSPHGWHRYNHHHHYHGNRADWVLPAIIGGAVVYAATRPAAPPPPTQPVVVYVPQGYPMPPAGFRYEQILDAGCNCHRWVLVQGQ